MRNLRKLFCIACTVFFFTACEETYNDKLFWPGEISQEYGSYIKPYTLDLTYSGEKLIGKTVSFKTEDSETGTLTLNDVIPGEKETPIGRIQLYESGNKDSYTFSGTNITMGGATVKYSGSITPKAMKLDVNVAMPNDNKFINSYSLANVTRGPGKQMKLKSGKYEWTDVSDMLLTSAIYFDGDAELTREGYQITGIPEMFKSLFGYFLPQVLKSITFETDGNIRASYSTDEMMLGNLKFSEIDPNNIAPIIMPILNLMSGKLTAQQLNEVTKDRSWNTSPKNLVYWSKKNNKVYIKLNLPGIISLAMTNSGQQADQQLIAGITDAILKSNTSKLQSLLGAANTVVDNAILDFISKIDSSTFQILFDWVNTGIPMNIKNENGHTNLYFDKETLAPIIAMLPQVCILIQSILPDSMTMLGTMLNGYIGTSPSSIPNTYFAATKFNFGLDFIPQ